LEPPSWNSGLRERDILTLYQGFCGSQVLSLLGAWSLELGAWSFGRGPPLLIQLQVVPEPHCCGPGIPGDGH